MLRIAEEDLNAANTLQGINPSTNRIHLSAFSSLSEHWKSDESSSLGSRPLSMLPGFRSEFPQQSTTNRMMNANIPLYNPLTDTSRPQARDTPGTTDALDLSEQAFDTTSLLGDDGDTSFFEFDLLESTDWLRDWGQHDSISPPSQPGVDNSGLDILDLSLWNTNYALSDDPPKTVLNAINQEEERNEKTEKGPATPAPDIPAVSTPRPADETAVPVPGLPTVGGGKDYNAVTDFLPWGWQHAPGSRQDRETKPKMTLPAIRQLLGERGDRGSSEGPGRYEGTRSPASDTLGSITDEMRSKMLEMLSTPSSRPPYALEGPEDLDRAFPNVEIVATFVRLYFQHFHPILPVIHKPSFSLERCPAILLIAMISIGASYSKLKNAKQFADGLSELCRRSLTWLSEKDPALGRTAFYLQSMCLQNLYAMGSGSTTLYDAADVSRSVLIGNARRIGLFSGSKSPTSSSPSSTPNSPSLRPGKSSPPFTASPDLETRWREWRDVEGRKRLAWGIFEYDSSFSTLSNRRGAITISDISIRLPCSESLWEASTAESWSLLLPQENDIQGYPFYSTLKLIIAGRFSVDCLTSWGKRIAAQAMGRIMWDFKELEESVLSTERDYNNPQKEALLSSLLLLCESASPPPPGSLRTEVSGDRYHWILARLIAHYTHLHAAFPTISLMLNIARKPPPQGEENADPRIRKLRRDLEGDREQGRRLAWHAAQIIALSRWNPVYSPVEGMRLFLAGVVLWGFAGFCGTGIGAGGPSSSYAGSGYAGSEGCGGTNNHDRDRERDLLRERERERERERDRMERDRMAMQYMKQPQEMVQLDILPWHAGPEQQGRGEEWVRTGRGKAVIHKESGVVEVCGEEGAKEVLRVVVGILGSLRVWGLGGEFKEVLEQLVNR
ncbi:fungal-specific transcription factor domain-containing protein [Pyronema omphalodes]|nr:fungal-specific transcription factor domain-containing protein [Pyronema omphalodes]